MEHKLSLYLKNSRLITDGSFGTYYADKYNTNAMPECANSGQKSERERVLEIHKDYIAAGAGLIRTNTFASNTVLLDPDFSAVEENIRQAAGLARRAVSEMKAECFIAGDIGPVASDAKEAEEEYYKIGRCFLDEGIDIINFETLPSFSPILPAVRRLKEDAVKSGMELFVMVQFCVNQFGYSAGGVSARRLLLEAAACGDIDAAGLNCGVGPGHMEKLVSALDIGALSGKYLIALPNAGYPKRVRGQIRFENNPDYFADKETELADRYGVDIVGGCCGTTPDYIRILSQRLDKSQKPRAAEAASKEDKPVQIKKHAFFKNQAPGRKLIAVELAPPVNAEDGRLLEAARFLGNLGVDVLTFPDSPSGRTRVDSVLMAEKVRRETGMCVMPHICCRDKNAIAMRSIFLGAHINDIHNFLIITGDPVPAAVRQTTKAVFNFDSVGLMQIARDMNEESFPTSPMTYGGAINQGRKNLDVEIGRVRKKMEAGAEFFMTQPVFTKEAAERVRRIKKETGARVLCGIMPLISRKNALFMRNEIAGVDVSDEIIARYPEYAGREEGEAVGVAVACEMIRETQGFADGYYFEFPFNRVYLLKQILNLL